MKSVLMPCHNRTLNGLPLHSSTCRATSRFLSMHAHGVPSRRQRVILASSTASWGDLPSKAALDWPRSTTSTNSSRSGPTGSAEQAMPSAQSSSSTSSNTNVVQAALALELQAEPASADAGEAPAGEAAAIAAAAASTEGTSEQRAKGPEQRDTAAGPAAAAAGNASSKAAAASGTPQSGTDSQDWEDGWKQADGEWEEADEDEYEDEYEDEGEDEDDEEVINSDTLRKLLPSKEQQEKVVESMRTSAYEAAIEGLAGTMLTAGFKGSVALLVGSLLNIGIIQQFRWDLHDVQTGVMWALPAAAMAAMLTILPLPAQNPKPALAGSSSSGSGSGSSLFDHSDVYQDLKRMARSSMMAKDIPITVEIPLKRISQGSVVPSDAAIQPITQLTWGSAVRTLRYLQESFVQPWSNDVTPPEARVVRVIDEQLRRLSSEVVWRGLVATCLAGIISSSWAAAGTSQDSPFFYARLFGLLTPQTSIAAAVGLLLLGRLPLLWLSGRPMAMYTRLSSVDVQIVGQLTDDDWLVKVVPASSSSSGGGSSKAGEGEDSDDEDDDWQAFGEVKARRATKKTGATSSHSSGSSSSSSSSSSGTGGSGSSAAAALPTQEQLDQQLEELLRSSAMYCTLGSSGISSNAGSAAAATAAVDASREQQGAELLAQLLEIVRTSAVIRRATESSSSSSSNSSSKARRSKAGVPSARVAAALQQVMLQLNTPGGQHYFVVHLGDLSVDLTDDSSDDEEDESSDDEQQAAAAGSSSSSSSVGDDPVASLRSMAVKNVKELGGEKRLDMMMRAFKQLLESASSRAQVLREGWFAAANVPTAEDRLARGLLLFYTLLTELAPAGAFVATNGNLAASFVASSCYNLLALTVNDIASQRARGAVRKSLGDDWLLRLLPLQGSDL